MCGYPGATFDLDFRLGLPKPIYEYYVTLLPQSVTCHTVHFNNGSTVETELREVTKIFSGHQPSQAVAFRPQTDFGETVRGPLVGLFMVDPATVVQMRY